MSRVWNEKAHYRIFRCITRYFLLLGRLGAGYTGFQIPSRPLAIGPLFVLWANQVDTKVAHIENV